jgi:hypothetical protein
VRIDKMPAEEPAGREPVATAGSVSGGAGG